MKMASRKKQTFVTQLSFGWPLTDFGLCRALSTLVCKSARLTLLFIAFIALMIVPTGARAQGAARTRVLTPQTPGVLVLFSGSLAELDQNFIGVGGGPAPWPVLSDRSMLTQERDIRTRQGFRDYQLHIEFRVPFMPNARGQQRGNSGVILHGRFEMQILDSYGIERPGVGDCGAVYNTHSPLVNACKPPNEWQAYEILFRAPRFDASGTTRLEAARVTAWLNGILVQNNVEIPARTGVMVIGKGNEACPLVLQFHNAPVQFRNILLLPLGARDGEAASGQPIDVAGASQSADPGAAPQQTRDWEDVPQGEQVPVKLASFDQGGYQIQSDNGQTILVPFVDQNLYAMKFGRSATGQSYFVNDGTAPVLYLSQDGYVANTAAQNARWYPITQDFNYTNPVYVGVAPSWNDYMSMGWYPGMMVYGGMWRYGLNGAYGWMPGYYTAVGGVVMRSFPIYRSYYTTHPGYTVVGTAARQRSAAAGPPAAQSSTHGNAQRPQSAAQVQHPNQPAAQRPSYLAGSRGPAISRAAQPNVNRNFPLGGQRPTAPQNAAGARRPVVPQHTYVRRPVTPVNPVIRRPAAAPVVPVRRTNRGLGR